MSISRQPPIKSAGVPGPSLTAGRHHEFHVYLTLRPSYYFFGKLISGYRLIHVPGLGYFVNDAEIARNVLHDKDHFSLKEAGGLGDLISQIWGVNPTLLSMEGEEHKRVKFALLDLFSEEIFAKIIGQELASFAASLKEKVTSPQGVDVVRETRIATNRITARIIGVETPNTTQALHISQMVTGIMGCIDLKHKTFTPRNRQKALAYAAEFKELVTRLSLQASLKDDSIIKRLNKLGYDDESMYGFLTMFVIAGTITVSSALPRIVALLIDTNQFAGLDNNAERVAKVIDEGLRLTTPGPILLMGIKKDTWIGAHKLRAGRRLMIPLYNITHATRYIPDPYAFNIDRPQNELVQGLWFGTGAHFCMGSVLAKKEIAVAIEALADVSGELWITRRTYMKTGINPGYDSLVIQAAT